MGRILAIDYGKKRVGLAVTDPLQIIATSLTTVSAHDAMSFLENYFKTEIVDRVVIGYPRQMNNELSEAVEFIDPFIAAFKKKFPDKPIELADERFTSKMAFQTMIDSGIGKMKRRDKALVDTISATIILQSYLEQKKNKM
ncbi:MAG: Holliday junction DNA helicase RuvA [Bacteroidetes bacterium RIFOXYA12_FULL_35_11]|nr:MAG: Holliday junction DNA helicase RuvA [Bacteroidetes bacterium GWF2_35_48]OFY77896.1 MAG: Holliday junction DNA helicase RuvA [Bacteroidetes bacterium RIFOXYA12_FULL_35_11]OFY95119.1 MAG: Holliday junction DNA helicase RuvA [Bacteroidetes bacterium RIFOXYB2_FULL_35_7]OFY96041.1 MAG: Holliday junction DNA helicase RuvA [Bacteroidetes bacterium RIFOXYC12_FULL_35_7]HBX50368.1 Holliday junction resolvase RuvX [Bacteroidales bacterium]